MVANFSLKCAPLHTRASTVAKPFVYKQSISGNRKGIRQQLKAVGGAEGGCPAAAAAVVVTVQENFPLQMN